MSDDLSHDAHLRAALRHAPDHALAPPAGVNQAILAAARQAHRPLRATPTTTPVQMTPAHRPEWLRWWQRLASPRWAGALATGLVAALGLGLWLDIGQSPVIERPAPRAPASEVAVPQQDHGSISGPQRGAAEAASDGTGGRDSPAAPAAATPDRTIAPKPRNDAAASLQHPATRAPPRAATAPDPSVDLDREAIAARPRDEARPAATQAAPPLQAAPAPLAKAAPRAAAPALTQQRAESNASDAQNEDARLATAPRATIARAFGASPALALLRRVHADRASQSTRWTWQAPQATTLTAFDDMGEAWLGRVAQAAGGRWTDTTDPGPAHDALEVRWWRDGWPHATLRIEADGLRWVEANGRIQYAPMDRAAMQRLRRM